MSFNNKGVIDHAKKIAKSLSALNAGDAVWILNTAINLITFGADKAATPNEDNTRGVNINLVKRQRGLRSKIKKDAELRQFIHKLDTFYTIEKLQKLLVREFGRSRAPSINTLSKYLKEMSQSTYLNQRVSNLKENRGIK